MLKLVECCSVAASIALVVLLTACASTGPSADYRPPSAPPPAEHVVVFFVDAADELRGLAESAVVDALGPGRAVASNTLIATALLDDQEAVASLLEREDFDGVLVMRLRHEFVPAAEAAVVTVNGVARLYADAAVETEFFAAGQEEPRWTSTSESVDGRDFGDGLDTLALELAASLHGQGLVAGP